MKYPIIVIEAPMTEEVIGNGFILRATYKPSPSEGERGIVIGGSYFPGLDGHLVIFENYWSKSENYYWRDVIGIYEPDTKKEDILPLYQKILAEKISDLSIREPTIEELAQGFWDKKLLKENSFRKDKQ